MNRKYLFIISCLLTACHLNSFAQSSDSDSLCKSRDDLSPKVGIEFFLFPAFLYSTADIGINYQTKKSTEFSFLLGSRLNLLFGGSFNVRATFNVNLYSRNRKNFLPIWFRVSNTRNNVGYEEGYFPHTLRLAIGTGYGRMTKLCRNFYLRSEIGCGVSLNFTSSKGSVFPYTFKSSDYSFDQQYPQYNPKVFPTVKLKFTFVKMFQPRLT